MLNVVNNATQTMHFSEVPVGTMFAWDDKYFIKTEVLYTYGDFCRKQGDAPCEALNIQTGFIHFISPSEIVTIYNHSMLRLN